jgi:xanthomonalisin
MRVLAALFSIGSVLLFSACATPDEGLDGDTPGEAQSPLTADVPTPPGGPVDPPADVVDLSFGMTWTVLSVVQSGTHVYTLVGSDATTNPYTGDTGASTQLPILCINKNNPANPGTGVLGAPVQTPGGAWRRTWSSATIALTAPVTGYTLISRAVADARCAAEIGPGYRMAEFHDGDPALWSGWDFWADTRLVGRPPRGAARFWVAINDQQANPWNF